MLKNLTNRIPLLLMTLLLTMSLSDVYLSFIGIDLTLLPMLLVGIVVVGAVELMSWNRWTFAGSGVLLLLHVLCSLVEVPGLHSLATSINDCAWDTYLKVFWTDRTAFADEFGTVLLISFVICLSIHLLYAKYRSVCLSALVLTVYIFFMEFYKVGTTQQVMFLLFLMLVALVVLYAQRWCSSGETKRKKKISLQYGTPLLCGILILSLLLNSVIDKTPNQEFQRWLEKQLYNLGSVDFGNIELPQFRQSIFEKDNGALGGNVSFKNQYLFSVTVNGTLDSTFFENSVYLRGVACDYFENDTWQTAIDDDKERLLTDYFYENLYFCGDGTNGSLVQNALAGGWDYYQERWLTVFNGDKLASEVIFNHTLTTGIYAGGENIYYDNSTYTYHKGDVGQYDVYYVALDRNSSAFRAFVGNAGAATFGSADLDRNLKRELETYYLQMPTGVSDAVASLAERLTDGYTNDYEKAAAIESYLKENYTYTLQPGNVPEGKNLVEYFLFESQKGYCVYYASAMVMLCRSVGIPARYVKGYRADGISNRQMVSVKDTNSHAWVEVWLPDLGWVTFDPVSSSSFQQNGTPPTPDRVPSSPSKPSPTPTAPTPTKTPTPGTATPGTATPGTATPGTATPGTDSPETVTPESALPGTATPNAETPTTMLPTPVDEPKHTTTAWWIAGIGGVLLLLCVAFFAWKRHAHDKEKADGPNRLQNAAMRGYKRLVCVYTFLGKAPKVGETVAQYLKRLENPEMEAMIVVLEDCFYHQGIMNKEQYKAFMTALRKVENCAMKEKGKLKWKWFRWKFRRKTLKDKL